MDRWTIEEVQSHLQSLGAGADVLDIVLRQQIDGEELLELSQDDMIKFGFPLGVARKHLRFMAKRFSGSPAEGPDESSNNRSSERGGGSDRVRNEDSSRRAPEHGSRTQSGEVSSPDDAGDSRKRAPESGRGSDRLRNDDSSRRAPEHGSGSSDRIDDSKKRAPQPNLRGDSDRHGARKSPGSSIRSDHSDGSSKTLTLGARKDSSGAHHPTSSSGDETKHMEDARRNAAVSARSILQQMPVVRGSEPLDEEENLRDAEPRPPPIPMKKPSLAPNVRFPPTAVQPSFAPAPRLPKILPTLPTPPLYLPPTKRPEIPQKMREQRTVLLLGSTGQGCCCLLFVVCCLLFFVCWFDGLLVCWFVGLLVVIFVFVRFCITFRFLQGKSTLANVLSGHLSDQDGSAQPFEVGHFAASCTKGWEIRKKQLLWVGKFFTCRRAFGDCSPS